LCYSGPDTKRTLEWQGHGESPFLASCRLRNCTAGADLVQLRFDDMDTVDCVDSFARIYGTV
jgi:hypothetical protein